MAKRKLVSLLLTVSVPASMSASAARREVRSLIDNQVPWSADEGDVKVRKLAGNRMGKPKPARLGS